MRSIAVVASLALLAACGSSSSGSSNGGPNADAGDAGASLPACNGTPGGGGTPAPRGDHAGAMDASGARFVVFGGDTAVPACPAAANHVFDATTWSLDIGCGTWTQVQAATPPPARARHAMATDYANDRAILFGGRTRTGATGAYTLFNDVWTFDFKTSAWAQVTTSGTAPTPRSNAAIVVDASANRLIVFGGNTSTDGLTFTPQADTYALDLASGAWSRIASSGAPPARLFHAMAVDGDARVAYVFAGGDANAFIGPFLTDVWALDLAAESWKKVDTTGDAPDGRIKHALAYDSAAKRLVTFGGHDDGSPQTGDPGNENRTYALDLTKSPAVWSKIGTGDAVSNAQAQTCSFPADFTTIDKASPERRSAFAFGASKDGRAMIVHGGDSDCGLLADAWYFGGASWIASKDSPIGQSCLRTQTTCKNLCG
jgi:N-acetylneuraminic acid mutarotase